MENYKDKEHKNTKKFIGSKDKTVQSIIHQPPSSTDPEGSYTGIPIYKNEKPTQDVDDL